MYYRGKDQPIAVLERVENATITGVLSIPVNTFTTASMLPLLSITVVADISKPITTP